MKNIKKFNELFDDPKLKANLEIPYLKGQLRGEISKWKDILSGRNIFVEKLCYHLPFLIKMKYKEMGNLISIGFDKDLKFSINDFAFIYFHIEIRILGEERYICKIFARAVRKGRELYNRESESNEVNFDELVKLIDDDGYNILTEFNNWTLDNLDYKGTNHLGPEDKPKNIRKN